MDDRVIIKIIDEFAEKYYVQKEFVDSIFGVINPNPDAPLNPEASSLYKSDKYEYYKKAYEFSVEYNNLKKIIHFII